MALRALEIGPGDEVITTPMTAFATVLAICRAGAMPVLADIEPDSGLLVAGQRAPLPLAANPGGAAGAPVRPDARHDGLARRCAMEHGIHLVEDCAQAHLARWQGRVAGSFGVAGAYSFYPTKNLGAIGDGGAW